MLRNAKSKLARAEREVEFVEGEIYALDEEENLATIRSWRGKPDWPAIMRSGVMTSTWMLRKAFLERMGFRIGNDWSDVDQCVVHVQVPAGTDPASSAAHVDRVRNSIEMLLPALVPHADGLVWFGISGENIENCAMELKVSRDLTQVQVVTMRHQRAVEVVECAGLGDALYHIQSRYPTEDEESYVTDPATAPGDTGEALRRAVTAYVEGCRIAGMPIQEFAQSGVTDADRP
jgi:hypothetical protein